MDAPPLSVSGTPSDATMGGNRSRTVDAVENAAMTRKDIATVFEAGLALQQKFLKIAHDADGRPDDGTAAMASAPPGWLAPCQASFQTGTGNAATADRTDAGMIEAPIYVAQKRGGKIGRDIRNPDDRHDAEHQPPG